MSFLWINKSTCAKFSCCFDSLIIWFMLHFSNLSQGWPLCFCWFIWKIHQDRSDELPFSQSWVCLNKNVVINLQSKLSLLSWLAPCCLSNHLAVFEQLVTSSRQSKSVIIWVSRYPSHYLRSQINTDDKRCKFFGMSIEFCMQRFVKI